MTGRSSLVRLFLALSGLILCGLAGAGQLVAQDDDEFPWKDSYYPYLTSQGRDFPLLMAHYEQRKAADYFARSAYAGKFSLDAGASLNGSRIAVAGFRAPLLWKNWRVVAQLGSIRDARFGFWGLGNSTVNDKSLVTSAQPFLYRARRTRYFGQAQVSRALGHDFSVALGAGVEHSHFSALPGPSVFRATEGNEVTDTDVLGGMALVYDTRDNDFNTHQGLFIEADVSAGSGGQGYGRFTGIARGYLPIREGTMVALRLLGSGTTGTPPLNAKFEVPAWENVIQILGGSTSHRGIDYQRLAGQHVLVANLEVRHNLLDLGDFGGITLLAFGDAGRVFEGESFRLTTEGMKVGGGGGIALRILRNNIFSFNFAGGSEGFVFSLGSGWMF
jgi:hypothetical protein